MTKVGALLFLLAAGSCPAQPFPGSCCTPGTTSFQLDWPQLASERVPSGFGASGQASGESISAARLLHKPPRKAVRAFLHGIKLVAAGDNPLAAAAFAAAIAVDPDFSEAHGNLAVEYTSMGRYDDAVPEFQRAIQLDPATALHHANFSFALVRLSRFGEAEAQAQTAVGLDPGDAVAQLLLGCLLARRPETRNLSENHLLYAARSLPEAHLALARVYKAQGATQGADMELRRYRQSGALRSGQGPSQSFLPGR